MTTLLLMMSLLVYGTVYMSQSKRLSPLYFIAAFAYNYWTVSVMFWSINRNLTHLYEARHFDVIPLSERQL